MAAGTHRTYRWHYPVLLGAVAALAMVALHLGDLDERAELQALDLRFRYCSSSPEPQAILHVDIDDRSLNELGR